MEGYWAESINWLTVYFKNNSSIVLKSSELFENSVRLLKLKKLLCAKLNNLFILGVSEEVLGRESSFVKHSKEVVILCEDSKEVGIKVMFPSGEIEEFEEGVKAAELMLEIPSFFVVNTRSLHIGRRFYALNADEELESGNVYVMHPMKRLNSVVRPFDMGAVNTQFRPGD
ncbi:hypothetical protein V8G54_006440 [Vigna mungo]|uniref:Uncharacterized protein n=1 Tax=Vigna mungo TaxID=3915 RepID=A0AAQ3P3B4_VIGMU